MILKFLKFVEEALVVMLMFERFTPSADEAARMNDAILASFLPFAYVWLPNALFKATVKAFAANVKALPLTPADEAG